MSKNVNNKISWTSLDGRAIEAWISIAANSSCTSWHASIDGKPEHSGRMGANTTNVPEQVKSKGIVALIGNVCLTSERYEALLAIKERMVAEYYATPAGLVAMRNNLALRVALAEDSLADAQEAAYNDDLGHLPTSSSRLNETLAELAKFDEQHPEIMALAAASRSDAVKRALELAD